MIYCAVNDTGRVIIGSRETVVAQIFTIRWEGNQPYVQAMGYKERATHSYNEEEYSPEEMRQDLNKHLMSRLRDGSYPAWQLFQQV